MLRVGKAVFAVLAVGLVMVGHVSATVYYVDFDGGSDAAKGTSPATAFKHCPGDRGAKDTAAAAVLVAGDTVVFKGGVSYRGMIDVRWAGSEGKPITYDGNTKGAFGKGRALFDGSEPLTEWQRCKSAEEVRGNPNWKRLYVTHIPKSALYQICLYEGDEFFSIARDPDIPDPFWPEDLASLRPRVDRPPFTETDVAITPGKRLRVNAARPMLYMLDGSGYTSAILDPLVGAEFTIKPNKPVTVESLVIFNHLQSGYLVAKEMSFAADGKEILKVALENRKGPQQFELKQPVTFRSLVCKVLSSYLGKSGLGALAGIQALDADGKNVLFGNPRTAYIDPTYFTQKDPHYWDGAIFLIPGSGALRAHGVVGFDPKSHKIIFKYPISMYRRKTHARYATFGMSNAPGILDSPGEFYFDTTSGKVILWPREKPGREGPKNITRAARRYAFDIKSNGFVTIQGFRVQKLGGGGGDPFAVSNRRVKTGQSIVIRDNEFLRMGSGRRTAVIELMGVQGARVENNRIALNRYASALVASNCVDLVTSNNRLHKNGATAIDYYGCRNSKLLYNTLTEHKGVHANGLTLYNGNKDCLVEGNKVSGGNNGMTIQGAENIIIRNNIFDGQGKVSGLCIWPQKPFRNVKVVNNLFLRYSQDPEGYAASLFSNSRCIEGLVLKNNIMDGYALEHYVDKDFPGEIGHNLCTWIGPSDHKIRGLSEGDIFEADLKKIFVDPDNGDYRLRPGSPAIDAGTDVGTDHDFGGNPVPQGKAPDIGAFEHTP